MSDTCGSWKVWTHALVSCLMVFQAAGLAQTGKHPYKQQFKRFGLVTQRGLAFSHMNTMHPAPTKVFVVDTKKSAMESPEDSGEFKENDGLIIYGGNNNRRKSEKGKKYQLYEVVAVGESSDGRREYLGQMRLPKNMNNGDRLQVDERVYVVVKTTVNFKLTSAGFKRKHFLMVEPAHSYILSLTPPESRMTW